MTIITITSTPPITTFTESRFNEIFSLIKTEMAKFGWLSNDGYTLGFKDYATFVGEKTAHLGLDNYNEYLVFYGEYQSEGRNAIGTSWVHIYPETSDDDIVAGVRDFAAEVHMKILDTYAMRLM